MTLQETSVSGNKKTVAGRAKPMQTRIVQNKTWEQRLEEARRERKLILDSRKAGQKLRAERDANAPARLGTAPLPASMAAPIIRANQPEPQAKAQPPKRAKLKQTKTQPGVGIGTPTATLAAALAGASSEQPSTRKSVLTRTLSSTPLLVFMFAVGLGLGIKLGLWLHGGSSPDVAEAVTVPPAPDVDPVQPVPVTAPAPQVIEAQPLDERSTPVQPVIRLTMPAQTQAAALTRVQPFPTAAQAEATPPQQSPEVVPSFAALPDALQAPAIAKVDEVFSAMQIAAMMPVERPEPPQFHILEDTGDVLPGQTRTETPSQVFMHVSNNVTNAKQTAFMSQLDRAGLEIANVDQESFLISTTHLRFYSEGLAEAAQEVAQKLGVEARDFSHLEGPDKGRIELWLAGPAVAKPPVRQPVAAAPIKKAKRFASKQPLYSPSIASR
ncbi:hypothetical protein E4Z66_15830 [Aliishimia ponticola]|uniref:Uncharacterized protein n=1 Tax=Aliishimia ponticola TaxID=2499833 RepID=A0A4S4NA36_9RHOB|nr:hypothetical protein [Aliishimia ponticola]THH35287.1 hypothetical protein E4Z66_15830 [Aliishimia ponticola]